MSLEPLEQLEANLADAERVYKCRKNNLDSQLTVALSIVCVSFVLSLANPLIALFGFLGVLYLSLMPASKRYPWSEPVLYRNERIK